MFIDVLSAIVPVTHVAHILSSSYTGSGQVRSITEDGSLSWVTQVAANGILALAVVPPPDKGYIHFCSPDTSYHGTAPSRGPSTISFF